MKILEPDHIHRLKSEMDQNGFCILHDLFEPDLMDQVRNRIDAQAQAEREGDVTTMDQVQREGDGNQWVYMLINKGDIFQRLLEHPTPHEIVRHVLGPNYLLSDFAATITHPGNKLMGMHRDQWWVPEPRLPDEPHQRCGDINRGNVSLGENLKSTLPINPPAVCNVLWMVSDFTVTNGGTRIVPGSHLSGTNPDPFAAHDAINATGNAGSCVIFEGRTWHSADLNSGDAPRYGITTYYGGPQYRQMNNFTYGARLDVQENLDDAKRQLLGFKPWGGYGATGDQHADYILRGEEQPGAMGRDIDD